METLTIPRYNIMMEPEKYKHRKKSSMFVDIMSLYYYIDKSTLEGVLPRLLVINCQASAFGYNKNQDTYWCKKHIHSKTELSIEIEIITKDMSSATIKFVFLTGTQSQIFNFMNTFAESLEKAEWFL